MSLIEQACSRAIKCIFGVKLAKTRTRPISSHLDQTSFVKLSVVVLSRQDGTILPPRVRHFLKFLSLYMKQSAQAGDGKRSRQNVDSFENDKGD